MKKKEDLLKVEIFTSAANMFALKSAIGLKLKTIDYTDKKIILYFNMKE